jgi:glyoxylase-like metal-dependent hydrolase (beta-lactamase superfamily II)
VKVSDPGPPAEPPIDPGADTAGLPPAPEVFQLEVGLLQNFCELLYCPDSGQAAVVDPAWEADRLLREAERLGVRITSILITHTHEDHIEGVEEIVRRTGAVTHVHPAEAERLRGQAGQLALVADRQDIAIGARGVRALETRGHTAGGTSYLADGYVITGDVLFVRGCGRTDFPGGDTRAMWQSLQRLAALPEETRIYPGHDYGPTRTSTLATECLENPYLRCRSFQEFRTLRDRRG